MGTKNSAAAYFVLVLGLALIISGFFVFIPESRRDNVFWLDISVACFVFLLSCGSIFRLFYFMDSFDKRIAGLGIRMTYLPMYSVLAVSFAVYAWLHGMEFKYQLYFQLICLFFLSSILFLSAFASGHAVSVSENEAYLKYGKEKILDSITRLEVRFSRDKGAWEFQSKLINSFRENVRYLTPSNNQLAREIETEIIGEIEKCYSLTDTGSDKGNEINLIINKCNELLSQRKKVFSN